MAVAHQGLEITVRLKIYVSKMTVPATGGDR